MNRERPPARELADLVPDPEDFKSPFDALPTEPLKIIGASAVEAGTGPDAGTRPVKVGEPEPAGPIAERARIRARDVGAVSAGEIDDMIRQGLESVMSRKHLEEITKIYRVRARAETIQGIPGEKQLALGGVVDQAAERYAAVIKASCIDPDGFRMMLERYLRSARHRQP